MHASNWEKTSLEVLKNKTNFINVKGDEFAVRIR